MNPDLDALAALLSRGHEMVNDLCKRQGEPGWRRWEMSIPARLDHDPDLVIGAALTAGDAAVAEVRLLRADCDAYRAALVEIARHVASPGAEDEANKLGVEDLPTLVECVRAEYGNGHAAGGQARMERCKQDIARALGLDGESPPEWGDLVERVRIQAADAAKERG